MQNYKFIVNKEHFIPLFCNFGRICRISLYKGDAGD